MKRKSKAKTVSHTRSLDCAHYSRCLMQAAEDALSSKGFSCVMCDRYRREKVTDEDRVLETIRALRLYDTIWKDCESGMGRY